MKKDLIIEMMLLASLSKFEQLNTLNMNTTSKHTVSPKPLPSKQNKRKFPGRVADFKDAQDRKESQQMLAHYLKGESIETIIGTEAATKLFNSGICQAPGNSLRGMRHSEGRLPAAHLKRRQVAQAEKHEIETANAQRASKIAEKKEKLKKSGKYSSKEINRRVEKYREPTIFGSHNLSRKLLSL